MGDVIAVGGVEQGTLHDGWREVGRGTRVLVEGHLVGEDFQVLAQADLEIALGTDSLMNLCEAPVSGADWLGRRVCRFGDLPRALAFFISISYSRM